MKVLKPVGRWFVRMWHLNRMIEQKRQLKELTKALMRTKKELMKHPVELRRTHVQGGRDKNIVTCYEYVCLWEEFHKGLGV